MSMKPLVSVLLLLSTIAEGTEIRSVRHNPRAGKYGRRTEQTFQTSPERPRALLLGSYPQALSPFPCVFFANPCRIPRERIGGLWYHWRGLPSFVEGLDPAVRPPIPRMQMLRHGYGPGRGPGRNVIESSFRFYRQ